MESAHLLARLNPDGSVDASFHPQLDLWVIALAVQADGKIVIGGYFTLVNGAIRRSIARLNATAAWMPPFSPRPAWTRGGTS